MTPAPQAPAPPPSASHRMHPVVRRHFRRNILVAAIMMFVSLLLGMGGFHFAGGYNTADSFSQAALLLGGEGPSGAYPNSATSIFAGCYALYSSLLYLVVTALLLAPVFGHVLRRYRLDTDEGAKHT